MRRRGIVAAILTVLGATAALAAIDAVPLRAGDNTWTSANLDTMDTVAIASSPDFDSDGILLATDPIEDIVWRTEDFAAQWGRVTPRQCTDPWALAISPNFANDKTVYLGDALSVWKSANRGNSWVEKSRRYGLKGIKALAVSPDYVRDNTLYAGTEDGVYVSRDGAETWELSGPKQLGEGSRIVLSLAISPNYAADRTVFAGIDQSGLFKTTDGGTQWAQGWLSIRQIEAIAFSPNYAQDRTAFAGNPHDGLYRTTSGASSQWQQVSDRRVHSIVVSPGFASDRTVYLGKSDGVRVSTDGGQTWTDTDGAFRERVNSLTLASPSQKRLFAGTFDKGVFEYTVKLPTATPTITPTMTPKITQTPDFTSTPSATATREPTETPEEPAPEPQVYLPALLRSSEFAKE